MSENAAVYISNRDLPSNAHIRHLVEGTRVHFFAEDEGHTEHVNWVRFDIRLPEGVATVQRLDIRAPELPERLQKICEFVSDAAAPDREPQAERLRDKLMKTRNLLRISGPPDASERLKALARQLASECNGLLFCDSSLWDPKGRLCLSSDDGFDPEAGWETLPSSLERKARSEQRLAAAGIPIIEALPPAESDEESLVRPPWEVARRASALVTVAARAEGLEQQRAVQFLQAWGIWEAASPKEQAFLLNAKPDEAERIQCLWRYECLWVMLWALRHIESLGLPSSVCDVRRAVKLVTGTSTDVFIGKSQLRPDREILDEADFIYRCHQAVTDSGARGEAIAGIDPSVTRERHIALNWLRAYQSKSWDSLTAEA